MPVGFLCGCSVQVEFGRKLVSTPDTLKEGASFAVIILRAFNLWKAFSVRLGGNCDRAFNLHSHVAEQVHWMTRGVGQPRIVNAEGVELAYILATKN